MPDMVKQPPWWRELLRKEAVGGHVVNTLVGLAVTFVVGLAMTAFWFIWAGWQGSYLWRQRSIGAAMAFAVVLLAMLIALAILRRRLTVASAGRSAPVKGYLDHKADSARGRDAITNVLNEITAITLKDTKGIKAGTARLERIFKRPSNAKRLAMEIAAARRSARLSDKTTRKLAKKVPLLANATDTYSHAELAFWAWFTANHRIEPTEAQARIKVLEDQLKSIQDYLNAQEGSKNAVSPKFFSIAECN